MNSDFNSQNNRNIKNTRTNQGPLNTGDKESQNNKQVSSSIIHHESIIIWSTSAGELIE